MSDFISISVDSLHTITGGMGGRGTQPPAPTPTAPTALPDETGKYCKDGMQYHTGTSGHGSVKTPLGLEVTGDFRYDHTECK